MHFIFRIFQAPEHVPLWSDESTRKTLIEEFLKLLGQAGLDLSHMTGVFDGQIRPHQTGTSATIAVSVLQYSNLSPIVRHVCRRQRVRRSFEAGALLLRHLEGPGRTWRGWIGARFQRSGVSDQRSLVSRFCLIFYIFFDK